MAALNKLKRTLRLKNNLLSSRYEICIERMKYFTQAYRDNQQDQPIIKRAGEEQKEIREVMIFLASI